jgi:hypothetical protein
LAALGIEVMPASNRKNFTWSWGLPLAASGLFALFEWLHMVLNRTVEAATLKGPGALGLLDGFFHVADIPLKLLTLFFVPLALARALAHCHQDARASRFVAGVWLASGLLLLGALSAARNPLSQLLNTRTTKFYPTSVSATSEPGFGTRATEFATRWSSGEIFAREMLVIVVSVAGLVALGYFLGHKWKLCAFFAALWLLLILFSGGLVLELVADDFDYDFIALMGATLVGPILFDVALLLPRTAVSPIASLAYVLMIGSSFFASRALAVPAPEHFPESGERAAE